MKIEIEWSADHYRADCKDLPGSPPVGTGATKELAVVALMWILLFDTTGGPDPRPWASLLKKEDPVSINGEIWKNPARGDAHGTEAAAVNMPLVDDS